MIQVQKIRRMLDRQKYSDITVGSVEEFQGQERRVIIMSTVRSSVEHFPLDFYAKLGFLRSPKVFEIEKIRVAP